MCAPCTHMVLSRSQCFLDLRMDGVSETNFLQCLYFFFRSFLLFASAIYVAYHRASPQLLLSGVGVEKVTEISG
jgi:hypothetical protein